MPNASISPVAGASAIGLSTDQPTRLPRTLYLYENDGIGVLAVLNRELYAYENDGIQPLSALTRDLYLYENDGIGVLAVLTRSLYGYESTQDLPVQPWLEKLDPAQQFPGGTVDLYGDGLGQYTEVGAASTITASSTNGLNAPANVVARSATAFWQSTDGATAWLRFTFAVAKPVYAIALEDLADATTNQWGTPLVRFSDGGADVTGATAVPIPASVQRNSQDPVGTVRTLYILPAIRTVTWVEVRIASGGSGAARGLSQAWVYADEGQNAETSQALLNALNMGVVSWSNRSPGLWPANGGLPQQSAATVTVPLLGTSGLVKVEES